MMKKNSQKNVNISKKLIWKCKKVLTKIMIIIFLVIFIITSYLLIREYLSYKDNEESNNELIEDVIEINPETQETTIDWDYLKSINEDIIAWIEIEGTKINYPILQDSDNLFYLKHSYNKKYSSSGSIFTTNKSPFLDEETIVYGHNMKNGSMFSMLDNYLDKDFLYSHLKIKIYTPTINYEGTIFSVYSISYATETNNIKELSFDERIEYYQNASKYTLDTVDSISNIVKLSTCSYINATTSPTNQRYYIIAYIIPIE